MKRKIFSTTMLVIMLLLSSCNSSLFSKCRKEKSLDYQYVGLYINFVDEKTKALDDSNVTRFAKYLHKLTKDTQFIVITHRRGTMMAADVLYGITMQEKGISTQVSVNLIENDLDE